MTDDPHRRHTLRKSQLIDFPNVAAGHDGVKASRSGALIVKPCKNPEVQFYQQNWKPDPDPSEFAYYMPKFFGTLNLQETPPAATPLTSGPVRPGTPASASSHTRTASRPLISHLPVSESLAPTRPPKKWEPSKGAKIEAENSVVLENVASGLIKPNILDIKLGARLWADDAPPDKRERLDQVAAATTSGPLGFRIAGMKIWAGDGAYQAWEAENRERMDRQEAQGNLDDHGIPRPMLREDDYASYDKEYGRALTTENVRRGFEEYFYRPPATGVRKDQAQEVITRFVEDLNGLQEVMENQETRMYSASLLFVYEGSGGALRESFRKENRMFREAREQMEALELAGQSPAEPAASASTSIPASTSHTKMPAPASSATLPPIAIDSALEIPSELMLADPSGAQDILNADSDASDSDTSDDANKLPKIQTLKVIDFAHATAAPGSGPDENFLKGVRSVIQILEDMLAERVSGLGALNAGDLGYGLQ